MELQILVVGDVVGEPGITWLEERLRPLQKLKGVRFTVVNGENAAGVGLTEEQAWRIWSAGADAVTLGNHTFGQERIAPFLDETPWILRPANFAPRAPGHGSEIFDLGSVRIRVVNLIGRCCLDWKAADPFRTMDEILSQGEAEVTLVDFHAETTSEKLALGWYLDGRVSALWGTHTHVPTADETVRPGGMGYVTDIGMTGPADSVIGIEPRQSIENFLGGLPGRYRPAGGPRTMQGAVFTIDAASGRCTQVERIEIRE